MNLALFDFDGTITTNNTWTPFLKAAVRPPRSVVGRLLLLPIITGHRVGVVPPGRARELANWVPFAGERSTPLRALGIRYATEPVVPGEKSSLCLHDPRRTSRPAHWPMRSRDCSGVEKVRRIKERCNLSQYSLVYAYGDTPDDREMLELAHRKFYRGKEVSSWDDVTEFEDPSPTDTAGEPTETTRSGFKFNG